MVTTLISRAELGELVQLEKEFLSTRKGLVCSFQLHKHAANILAERQVVFLKKVLFVDDGQIPDILALSDHALMDLLHRGRNAGVWELAADCPNFKLSKEALSRLRVELVDGNLVRDLRRWWQQHPR
jgi:hypothetical protein